MGLALVFIWGVPTWLNWSPAGTFGRVLECWDREAQEYVAIKVIRNVQKYRDAAMIEIDVLRALAKHDKTGSRSVLSYDMTCVVLPPYLAPLTVAARGCYVSVL
jgi:hypothetical protein